MIFAQFVNKMEHRAAQLDINPNSEKYDSRVAMSCPPRIREAIFNRKVTTLRELLEVGTRIKDDITAETTETGKKV